MSDDDFDLDDDQDEEETEEEETPAPRRRSPRPSARRQAAALVPPPPTMGQALPPLSDDPEGLNAEQARYEQRLRDGYSKPLPAGTPKAMGIEGWDQEYSIIEKHGLTQVGRIIFSRLRPPGTDGKPLSLGSVIPSQLGPSGDKTAGEVMFAYLCENFSDPAREILIGWTYHDRVRRRTGEMSIPVKAAPRPERRADAGPSGTAVLPSQQPQWGPASAHYPPGYPPPGYPGGWGYGSPPPAAPAPADKAPSPASAPLPPNMPPEVATHVQWLQNALNDANQRLWDARGREGSEEVAQLRQSIGSLGSRLEQIIQSFQHPGQAAPAPAPAQAAAPPPASRTFAEQAKELEDQMAVLERIRQKFTPPAPAAPAASAPEPVESSDDPVQTIKADDGTTAIIDRKTGDMKIGQSLFMNMSIIKGLFDGVVTSIKDATIEVKKAGPQPGAPQPQGGHQSQQQAPTTHGGGGRGWKT